MSFSPTYSDHSNSNLSPIYNFSEDENVEEGEVKEDDENIKIDIGLVEQPEPSAPVPPTPDITQYLHQKIALLEEQLSNSADIDEKFNRLEEKIDNLSEKFELCTEKIQGAFLVFSRNIDNLINNVNRIAPQDQSGTGTAVPVQKKIQKIPKIKVEPGVAAQKKHGVKCIFCEANHASKKCTKYKTVTLRRAVMKNKNLCMKCLKPNNAPGVHNSCPEGRTVCQTCQRYHNPMFCRDAEPPFCVFCQKNAHTSSDCSVFRTSEERKNRLSEKRRCFQCFEQSSHRNCMMADEICKRCGQIYGDPLKARHHPVLCERIDELKPVGGGPVRREPPRRISHDPYHRVDSYLP